MSAVVGEGGEAGAVQAKEEVRVVGERWRLVVVTWSVSGVAGDSRRTQERCLLVNSVTRHILSSGPHRPTPPATDGDNINLEQTKIK